MSLSKSKCWFSNNCLHFFKEVSKKISDPLFAWYNCQLHWRGDPGNNVSSLGGISQNFKIIVFCIFLKKIGNFNTFLRIIILNVFLGKSKTKFLVFKKFLKQHFKESFMNTQPGSCIKERF